MNEVNLIDKLRESALSPEQQQRLYSRIEAIFKRAIDIRAPRNRPPGKAGLRAEKGYYRLLYLEGDFLSMVNAPKNVGEDLTGYDWAHVSVILRQLADLPELQAEMTAGIADALMDVTAGKPDQ